MQATKYYVKRKLIEIVYSCTYGVFLFLQTHYLYKAYIVVLPGRLVGNMNPYDKENIKAA